MMLHCQSVDIEGTLQAALEADGYTAAAPPVPANLAPSVYIHSTGGFSQSYVQDVHTVDFDAYDTTEAQAMSTACQLTEWVRALPERQGLEVPTYAAEITTLPYNNPDPNHPTLKRATFSAQITTRVKH